MSQSVSFVLRALILKPTGVGPPNMLLHVSGFAAIRELSERESEGERERVRERDSTS